MAAGAGFVPERLVNDILVIDDDGDDMMGEDGTKAALAAGDGDGMIFKFSCS